MHDVCDVAAIKIYKYDYDEIDPFSFRRIVRLVVARELPRACLFFLENCSVITRSAPRRVYVYIY